jgi:AcrR family transcriptional regulator
VSTVTPLSDGRSQRRDRNRESVVTALLELYREGRLGPSADEIAARAGISVRSLFRYFEDIEALVRAAIVRQQEHVAPLYALDVSADLPLPERLDRFVAGRLRLLQGMGEVGRVARNLAVHQPLVLAELARIRHALRGQLAEVFAPELDALPAAERRTALAAADVVVSWEALDLMHNDQGLPVDLVAAAMRAALARLLVADADADVDPSASPA